MNLARFSTIQREILDYIHTNDRKALEKYMPGTKERDELDELKAGVDGENAREIDNLLNMIDRYLNNDIFFDNSPSNVDLTHYTPRRVLDLLKKIGPQLQSASDKLDDNDRLKNYYTLNSYEILLNAFNNPTKALKTAKRYVETVEWTDEHNTNSKEKVLADIERNLETIAQLKIRIKKIMRRVKMGYTSSSSRKSSSSSRKSSSSSRKSSSSSRKSTSPKSPDFPPPPRLSPRSPDLPPHHPRLSPRSPDLPPHHPRLSPRSPDSPPPQRQTRNARGTRRKRNGKSKSKKYNLKKGRSKSKSRKYLK